MLTLRQDFLPTFVDDISLLFYLCLSFLTFPSLIPPPPLPRPDMQQYVEMMTY